jgi:hypothetical protein
MSPQLFTAKNILRIIRNHPEGISVPDLLGALLQRTERSLMPLYLGPGITVRNFIDNLVRKGMVRLFVQGNRTTIRPTSKLLRASARGRQTDSSEELVA